MRNLPIAKDAFMTVIVLLAITILLYYVYIPLAVVSFILLVFVMFFFRNPHRKVPSNDEKTD
jgi:phosphatidylserine decarboxylase